MAVTVSLHAEQSCGCARSDGRFKERHLTLATISFDSLVHVNFFSHSNYLYHFLTLLSSYLRCCLLDSLTSDCTRLATERLTNRSRHIPEPYYRYLQTIPLDLRQTNSGLRCTPVIATVTATQPIKLANRKIDSLAITCIRNTKFFNLRYHNVLARSIHVLASSA
jgi:hypothetical protein